MRSFQVVDQTAQPQDCEVILLAALTALALHGFLMPGKLFDTLMLCQIS